MEGLEDRTNSRVSISTAFFDSISMLERSKRYAEILTEKHMKWTREEVMASSAIATMKLPANSAMTSSYSWSLYSFRRR
jgi:hypothetical protein